MQKYVKKCNPQSHRHHMHCCPTPPRCYGPTYNVTYDQFVNGCFRIPHEMRCHCKSDCDCHDSGDLVLIKDCQPHCHKNLDICHNSSVVDASIFVPSELQQVTKYRRNVHCGDTNIGQIVNTYNVVINDNSRNKRIIETLDKIYREICYDQNRNDTFEVIGDEDDFEIIGSDDGNVSTDVNINDNTKSGTTILS